MKKGGTAKCKALGNYFGGRYKKCNINELPYIQSMMDAGAKGYVLKNIEPADAECNKNNSC